MTVPPTASQSRSSDSGDRFLSATVTAWLAAEARSLDDPRELLDQLCRRLVAAGLPLIRSTFHLPTLHPQLRARSFLWRRDRETATAADFRHEGAVTPEYLESPVAAIFAGAGGVRCRLDADPPQLDYPITRELAAEGATDYVMMPLRFSDGKINAISWTSDRAGGFATEDLSELYDLLPLLALLLEVAVLHAIATTVLETYIGRGAARRVLDGEITRGGGQTIRAVLWYCDLRDFTRLGETLRHDELIALLNAYFDCMAGPLHAQGGEVLKFMGDGMLGLFPCGTGDAACEAVDRALRAATDALAHLDALNRERAAAAKPALKTGLALHLGEVMYGNIGAIDRLDFTVIGAAVNLVARVEQLCREVERPLLTTAEFAAASGDALVSLGHFRLRGVNAPQEIFGLPENGTSLSRA